MLIHGEGGGVKPQPCHAHDVPSMTDSQLASGGLCPNNVVVNFNDNLVLNFTGMKFSKFAKISTHI